MKTMADVDHSLFLRGEIAALEARAAVYRDALRTLEAEPPPAPPAPESVAEHAPPRADLPAGVCEWNACGRPLSSAPAPKCGSPERHEGGRC